MLKRAVLILTALMFAVPSVLAQQAKQAPPAQPEAKADRAAPKAPAEPAPLPLNIKIEVSITDQTGTGSPAKKVVTMIAGDRQPTNVRSVASVPVKGPSNMTQFMRDVTINVDARPTIMQKEPNKISLNLGLEYFPKAQGAQEVMEAGMASFSERLALFLESGKPMMISQAADPTSDRKISVEVTATILK